MLDEDDILMFKWFMITMVVLTLIAIVGTTVKHLNDNQCRVIAIQHNVSADSINKVCGIKE